MPRHTSARFAKTCCSPSGPGCDGVRSFVSGPWAVFRRHLAAGLAPRGASSAAKCLLTSNLMKSFPELLGDGPGFAGADGSAVTFDNGNDLGGGAGEETFVGRVNVQTRQGCLLNGDLGRLGQLNDRVPRHAFQNARVDGRR